MSKEDILLKEYETCQSHNNSIGSQVWVSTSIFMSINVALLGGVAYSIITNGVPLNAKWLVLILGLGIILIFVNWIRWLKRTRFLTNINYERMREIEDELGMEKNWLARGLDLKYDSKSRESWDKLPVERKEKLQKINEHYKYAPPRGFETFICIVSTIMALWVILIVMAFVF